jgi:hypothetical protein
LRPSVRSSVRSVRLKTSTVRSCRHWFVQAQPAPPSFSPFQFETACLFVPVRSSVRSPARACSFVHQPSKTKQPVCSTCSFLFVHRSSVLLPVRSFAVVSEPVLPVLGNCSSFAPCSSVLSLPVPALFVCCSPVQPVQFSLSVVPVCSSPVLLSTSLFVPPLFQPVCLFVCLFSLFVKLCSACLALCSSVCSVCFSSFACSQSVPARSLCSVSACLFHLNSPPGPPVRLPVQPSLHQACSACSLTADVTQPQPSPAQFVCSVLFSPAQNQSVQFSLLACLFCSLVCSA